MGAVSEWILSISPDVYGTVDWFTIRRKKHSEPSLGKKCRIDSYLFYRICDDLGGVE